MTEPLWISHIANACNVCGFKLKPWETNTSPVYEQSWKVTAHLFSLNCDRFPELWVSHSSSTNSIAGGCTLVPKSLEPHCWISDQFLTTSRKLPGWGRPPACFLQVEWIFLEVAMEGKSKCYASHRMLALTGFCTSLLLLCTAEKCHFVAD